MVVVLGNSFRYFQRQVASHSLAAVACTPTVQHSQGMDESFECPQDELEFLLCLNEEIDDIGEEEPDYQCLTRNVVRCSVVFNGRHHKFHVHMGECWENFELRNIAVVDYYKNETQHLVVEVPFIGCAHCGDNIINTIPYRLCDTCCEIHMLN